MNKKTLILLISMLFAATCFAVDSDSTAPALPEKETTDTDSASVLPEKDSLEYWMVRSQALTELTPFLTRMRTETKGHYNALTDYLKFIGKGQDFARSGIKAHLSPAAYAKAIGKTEQFVEKNIDLPNKLFTWEELVEWAMEFVLEEGYTPSDVSGDEEVDMIKKICQQKEKYGRKVRDELRKFAQDCLDMKAYLESIDEFETCIRYTRYQKEEAEKARLGRAKEGRKDLAEKERERREEEKENRWEEKQTRIANKYQRRMYATSVRGSAYGGRRSSYYRW
jgi:hypothetical protein